MEGKTVQGRFFEAWAACENPELDSENPHFRNRYASLKATLDAVRRACVPAGLAYVQRFSKTDEGRGEIRSCVVTESGESMELSVFPVECPPNPQSFGSNLTYAKRQQAQADWCITGENDDDGEAGASYADGGRQRKAAKPKAAKPSKEAQFLGRCLDLKSQCMALGVKESGLDGWFAANFGDVRPEGLSIGQLTEWGKYLNAMAEAAAQTIGGENEHQPSGN